MIAVLGRRRHRIQSNAHECCYGNGVRAASPFNVAGALAMTIQKKISSWRSIGRFCTARLVDYGELIPIELAETKKRVLHEVVAMVALAIGALFTLSFVSIAVIVTAVGTPHLVLTAWCVAGVWLAVAVIAVIVMMSRKPAEPFQLLRNELRRDVDTIREAAQ
jgi:uncharacterized membrane protein YqjE